MIHQKSLLPFSALFCLAVLVPAASRADDFGDGLRRTMTLHRQGKPDEVREELRKLMKLMDERSASRVEELIPATLGQWKGETVKKEEMPGGGSSISRVYVAGPRRITVKVIKDSPLVAQLLPLLSNDDLVRLSGRSSHRIDGETAVMEGENKLQAVVDGRIYLELAGDEETGEKELVSAATKMGFSRFKKL